MQQRQTTEDAATNRRRNELHKRLLSFIDEAEQIYREHEERQKANASDMPELTDDAWQAIRDQWETRSLRHLVGDAVRRLASGHQTPRRRAAVAARRCLRGRTRTIPRRATGERSDGGPSGQPILDRAQLALKHQAEWAAIDAIQADVLAAFQSIRTRLQRVSPARHRAGPNRKSGNGAQNLAPGQRSPRDTG